MLIAWPSLYELPRVASRWLGWKSVPVRVVDLQDIVRGENDENAPRKDFLPSEMVAIAKALEPIEREAAKERHGRPPKNSENLTGFSGAGNALDKVASAVGVSRPTLTKAAAVVEAAEHEPEKYAPLVEEMDRTGKVKGQGRK